MTRHQTSGEPHAHHENNIVNTTVESLIAIDIELKQPIAMPRF